MNIKNAYRSVQINFTFLYYANYQQTDLFVKPNLTKKNFMLHEHKG